jgi:CO/xanthine dehydrogenase Mo-binding subunit
VSAFVVSRRIALAGTGALLVSFALTPALPAQESSQQKDGGAPSKPPLKLPGSLEKSPYLDSWIRVDSAGAITVFTGKAELGQGIKTALLQIAAEQLDADLKQIKLITADTGRTPNEGYTAGSHSLQDSGTAIMNAAAQVRQILVAQAARRANVPPPQMKTQNGAVVAPDGRRFSYGELVGGEMLHVEAAPQSPLKDPHSYQIMNHAVQRVDIPAKVTGGLAYVQDLRMPGMVHGRVVRPPSYGAKLGALDTAAVEQMPGVIKVVRDGNFLAVIAEREFAAIEAMRSLAAAARWQENAKLPKAADLSTLLAGMPSQDITVVDQEQPGRGAAASLTATYTRPYLAHGSIGPSCAVAQLADNALTVWTHTQGVYPDRNAIAQMLGMPQEQVRCIHSEGSGCYGHNGADDAAADAALLARAVPGRPVRVQWMREQEHGWEPFGPAMVVKVAGSLDHNGGIANWDYGVWSNTHSTRPGPAGSLLAARDLEKAFPQPPPKPIPMPEGGGDRNSVPLYKFPSTRVIYHFLPTMPLRVSALRSLGAYMNVFAIECFMDELAQAAGADPVAFRLKHLDDERARTVISTAAARFDWAGWKKAPGRGRGFGFARYKNLAAYCAVACEVEIEHQTGRARMARAVAAVDSGQVVNPNGLANQIEGAILQSMSWTLYESVTFDATRITSLDWASYPVLRFSAVPDALDIHIINQPGLPFLGSGECGQGPAAAALANAVAEATGKRLRDLPLSRERIKAAIGS